MERVMGIEPTTSSLGIPPGATGAAVNPYGIRATSRGTIADFAPVRKGLHPFSIPYRRTDEIQRGRLSVARSGRGRWFASSHAFGIGIRQNRSDRELVGSDREGS